MNQLMYYLIYTIVVGLYTIYTSLDQFSIFTKCRANVTSTLKQWEQWQLLSLTNTKSSSNSEILNRVIEIEKQWLQCQLLYSIVTRCIPLNAILLADPTSSYVNCQELLHTIDTAVEYVIRLMESIQDIVPFSHIRQLLVHDDNEIECEKEIESQDIVFVELYISTIYGRCYNLPYLGLTC